MYRRTCSYRSSTALSGDVSSLCLLHPPRRAAAERETSNAALPAAPAAAAAATRRRHGGVREEAVADTRCAEYRVAVGRRSCLRPHVLLAFWHTRDHVGAPGRHGRAGVDERGGIGRGTRRIAASHHMERAERRTRLSARDAHSHRRVRWLVCNWRGADAAGLRHHPARISSRGGAHQGLVSGRTARRSLCGPLALHTDARRGWRLFVQLRLCVGGVACGPGLLAKARHGGAPEGRERTSVAAPSVCPSMHMNCAASCVIGGGDRRSGGRPLRSRRPALHNVCDCYRRS